MEREKPTFDILGRIEKERAARNWSEYALAENSGLTQSTISTIFSQMLLLSRKFVPASASHSLSSFKRKILFT